MKYKNFILCQNLNKIVQIIWSTLLFLIFLDHSSTFEAFWQSSFGQFIEKYPAPEILLVLSVGGLLYLYFFIK